MIETKHFDTNLTSNFVNSNNHWIIRDYLFSYDSSTGEEQEDVGSRTVLIVK